jgi:uncharacterized membrane protein YccC
MKEDPTRDPASEARDDWEQLCQPLTDEERRENARKIEALSVPDRFALMFRHASEPRETPETDALVPSQGRIRTMREYIDELEAHARCLERQRDELMEALESLLQHRPRADWEGLTIAEGLTWDDAEDLIAAVKGGTP